MLPQVGVGWVGAKVWCVGLPYCSWRRDPSSGSPPLRESADKVVLHTGKYEELIVCSHEIAASTAQLVAASKVSKAVLMSATPGFVSGLGLGPSPASYGQQICAHSAPCR